MTISLAVVDATQVVRAGIREIASTTDTIHLGGEWSSVQEFHDFLKERSVDVLLLGDTATKNSLKRTVQQLLEQQPKLKVIVLAASFSNEVIDKLSALGAVGFICKDEELAGFLVNAVQYAKRGDVYISPETARGLFLAGKGNAEVPLRPRQMQVLNYMTEYLTPQEIARKMDVSVSSVYNLQQRLRLALGVKTSGQILIEATKRGLIGEREQK